MLETGLAQVSSPRGLVLGIGQVLGTDQEWAAPVTGPVWETDRGAFHRTNAKSFDKIVSRGGKTSGKHFETARPTCLLSVQASGAGIPIGVGAGTTPTAIGGVGPRGDP